MLRAGYGDTLDSLRQDGKLLRWGNPEGLDLDSLERWLQVLSRAAAGVNNIASADAEARDRDVLFAEGVVCSVGDVCRFLATVAATAALRAAFADRARVRTSNTVDVRHRSDALTTSYLHRLLHDGLHVKRVTDAQLAATGVAACFGGGGCVGGVGVAMPTSWFGSNDHHHHRRSALFETPAVDQLAEAAMVFDDDVPRVVSCALTGDCLEGETLFLHVQLSASCGGTEGVVDHSKDGDDDDELSVLGPSKPAATTDRAPARIRWFRISCGGGVNDEEVATLVAEGTTSYRCATSDVGCYIAAEIVPMSHAGGRAVAREGLSAITRCDVPVVSLVPFVESLRIGGETYMNEVLTASYTFKGGDEGRSVIRWYRSLDGQRFTLFATTRAPDRSLTVGADLVHHYLRVQVTPIRRDDTKGNVVISKLVYVNLPPEEDQRLWQRVATCAMAGKSSAGERFPCRWKLPQLAAQPAHGIPNMPAMDVVCDLIFNAHAVSVKVRTSATLALSEVAKLSSSGLGSAVNQRLAAADGAAPSFRWGQAAARDAVYGLLAPSKEPTDLVWLEALTSCGGATANPVMHIFVFDSTETRDDVLLAYRAMFALGVPAAVNRLLPEKAAVPVPQGVDLLRQILPFGSSRDDGASDAMVSLLPADAVASAFSAHFAFLRTVAAGRVAGLAYEGLPRPGSDRTGFAIVEECLLATEEAAGKRLAGGGGGSASNSAGGPPRLPLVVPNLPGVFF